MQLIQMNQINQLKSKMNIPQGQMPMFSMNPFQMNKPNNPQINPNLMNNQMKMGMQSMNNIPGVQPMIPMPMPMPMPMNMYQYPNPMVMQTLYQQDIMRQKEIQQLNKNYEYQLMRQKIWTPSIIH